MAEMLVLGWREWVSLPELGLPAIKAKVDTGARTSALHAFYIEPYRQGGSLWVRFGVHPLRRTTRVMVECQAEVQDRRVVSDSGGHRELRYCIFTPVCLGKAKWPIEVTLTNRDPMLFRMLLGRNAISGRAVVDPASSYLLGKPKAKL
ncbi:MAG: ATP-dependent zinc protease [Methylohalobius sp.]